MERLLEKRLVLKDWAAEDRPREKLLQKGISSLSDAELIAILLRSGSRTETAVELGRKILNSVHDNLNELGKVSVRDLQKKFKGVGDTKAVTIVAALELGRRRSSSSGIERSPIKCSRDIYNAVSPFLADLPYEEFWVLLLNRANHIVEKLRISQGGISGTAVDVRLVIKSALERNASSIVLCHNHPSGTVFPSTEDVRITEKIRQAAAFFDVRLLDHVIVGNLNYYSFTDENRME